MATKKKATPKKTTDQKTAGNKTSAAEPPEAKPFDENVKTRSTWLRLFFMAVVVFLYGVSRIVVAAVVVLQFFWVLFTGSANPQLANFGQALATYTYQVVLYLTFATEERPFPFDADWPVGPPGGD